MIKIVLVTLSALLCSYTQEKYSDNSGVLQQLISRSAAVIMMIGVLSCSEQDNTSSVENASLKKNISLTKYLSELKQRYVCRLTMSPGLPKD